MTNIQKNIASELKVHPPFKSNNEVRKEVERRISFISEQLYTSKLKTLVLGISGGVDSTVAGLMAQSSINKLRKKTGNIEYKFIAVRMPYNIQHDEIDANVSLDFISPDLIKTVNIASAVEALRVELPLSQIEDLSRRDFIAGNCKARMRMVVQYGIASIFGGLVIGTDHASEAVMGFFTKFGDGASDIAPLNGLIKSQVREIAQLYGVPQSILEKKPTADLEDLRPGLPDEVSLGVSYTEIDSFLRGERVSEKAFKTIHEAYKNSLHKRKMPMVP